TENFEDLGNLKRYILRGLFSRAIELDFADIPANLIIKCWIGEKGRSTVSDSLLREEKTIPQLLTKHPELFEKVWTLTLNLAGQEDERIYTNGLANLLGGVCTDRIFALIPPTTEGLTWSQQRLIVSVLGPYFGKEPTQERLLRFQQSAPVFTQRLRLPQPPKQPPPRDPLEDKQKLLNALKQGKENPLAQTWYVLLAVTALERKIKHPEPPPEEKVLHVLARIAPSARRLILAAFRGCVARVRYEYERIGPSQYSMTREEYEVPFWILQHYGEKFTSQKLAEIISCYAFSGIRNAEKGRYEAPCEELRHQDWELWRQCMWRWLEEDSSSLNSSLQYLTKISERFYLPRCAERLEQNLFGASTFSPLLNYLLAFRPAGYIETLQRCYRILKDRLCQKERQSQEQSPTDNRDWAETGSEQAQVEHPPDASPDPRVLSYWHQFRPLLALMGEDDEWAWDEFAGRLALEDVPLDDSFHLFSGFRFPLNERRLPMLADWYALIRRKTDDSHFVAFSLAPRLLETIVTIGGQSAIQELRRLQRDRSFPSARWLSHEIMRIEDNLLTEEIGGWESRSLLDFVNKEKLGVVLNEHDLFEWVCQAIEEVQEAFERRGEAVTGFWNGNEPKTEPQCQNVLWPLLQLTLRKSSIAAVEVQEFSIGPNYCDFCVQYPRSGQPPFRVAVELKRLAKAMGRLSLSIPSKPSCGKSICAQPSVSTGSSAYFGSVTINVTKVLPIGLVVISLPRRYARNVRPLWPLTNL
ncbi:MAG TPA: hypothetical protein VKK81_15940, partial [Candidatus Binatia bacterium]|nr:hypothetical protein [Candidatus Binatia bacterium]